MKCEMCGEEKLDAEICCDPLIKELYDELVDIVICKDCYQERVNDI